MTEVQNVSLSTAWRKAALEVDLPFGLTPRGKVLCADAAVRVVLDRLEMALKPRDEVDADGMPYRYRPSAVRVIDDLRAELAHLERRDGE